MSAEPTLPYRVLLVAADRALQRLVATIFGTDQFDLTVAPSLRAARDTASETRPALVVITGRPQLRVDWVMAARKLREEPTLHSLPIIAIGLQPEEEGNRIAAQVGVDAYFRHPISPFRLLLKAQELIERHCKCS